MEFDVPKYINKELHGMPPDTISLHRHMYVDDHAEIHLINKIQQIQELLTPIMDIQKEWGFITNMDKSYVLIKIQGKGCTN